MRHGLGGHAVELIEEILAGTPAVLDRVAAEVPRDYPDRVATKILTDLRLRIRKVASQPNA